MVKYNAKHIKEDYESSSSSDSSDSDNSSDSCSSSSSSSSSDSECECNSPIAALTKKNHLPYNNNKKKNSSHVCFVVVRNSPQQVSCKRSSQCLPLTPKPMCKYGMKCYRKNPEHFKKYRHPKNFVPSVWHTCVHTRRRCPGFTVHKAKASCSGGMSKKMKMKMKAKGFLKWFLNQKHRIMS